jgi:cytochrome P450
MLRYNTAFTLMRRQCMEDTEVGGHLIRKGDKVIMWYVSGNRDSEAFDNPDDFLIARKNARQHVSFGFGIHRCMGNRLGEMQLRILWEEILARFEKVEMVEEPERNESPFVKGYQKMMVRLIPRG